MKILGRLDETLGFFEGADVGGAGVEGVAPEVFAAVALDGDALFERGRARFELKAGELAQRSTPVIASRAKICGESVGATYNVPR